MTNNSVLQALALGTLCVIYAVKGAMPAVIWAIERLGAVAVRAF